MAHALGAATMVGLMLGGLVLADTAAAQEAVRRPQVLVTRPVRVAARPDVARPLTVHRRVARVTRGRVVAGYGYDAPYAGPGLVRRWNDPNLDSFGGWRLGGDTFYGDQRGSPITRGNSTLGMISGYGGARGGYGGPHFDSVGGFHDGPGPDAQESADYASGSISRPDYGGIVPHYPSLRQRVAALNTGIPFKLGPARATSAAYAGGVEPAAYRASAEQALPDAASRDTTLPGTTVPNEGRYAQAPDIFPGFGLMDDGGF